MSWEQTVTFIGVADLEAADVFFLRLGLHKVATQHNAEGVQMVYIYRSTPDAFLGITHARASQLCHGLTISVNDAWPFRTLLF